MKPGVVRQLTREEIELAARKNDIELPEEDKHTYVMGFVYTDVATADEYVRKNTILHGHTAYKVTDSSGNPASILIIRIPETER